MCIRFSVQDIRAIFNIHVFCNRMHIASTDSGPTSADSALYCSTFVSFLIRRRDFPLSKWLQRPYTAEKGDLTIYHIRVVFVVYEIANVVSASYSVRVVGYGRTLCVASSCVGRALTVLGASIVCERPQRGEARLIIPRSRRSGRGP